jgi:hypothetical protein
LDKLCQNGLGFLAIFDNFLSKKINYIKEGTKDAHQIFSNSSKIWNQVGYNFLLDPNTAEKGYNRETIINELKSLRDFIQSIDKESINAEILGSLEEDDDLLK